MATVGVLKLRPNVMDLSIDIMCLLGAASAGALENEGGAGAGDGFE